MYHLGFQTTVKSIAVCQLKQADQQHIVVPKIYPKLKTALSWSHPKDTHESCFFFCTHTVSINHRNLRMNNVLAPTAAVKSLGIHF